MDVSFCIMHFNRDSIIMIIINTLREMHLCIVTSLLSTTNNCPRPNHPHRAFQIASSPLPLPPSPPSPHIVLFAQDASATLCVPLLSNLINVPVQRETEGLRFVAGRMAIRFSLTRNPSLFSIVALVVSPECSICTYFELNVGPQRPPR